MAENNIDRSIRDVEKAMKKAARMVGATIANHAQERCPVDTGLLRNSITFAVGGEAPNIQSYTSNSKDKAGKLIDSQEGHYDGRADADSKGEVTVYVGTNVQYAPYQELGAPNRNLDARPFLRPAFEEHRDEIERIVTACLREVFR